MQQFSRPPPPPDGHHERAGDHLSGHRRAHRQADHAAQEVVEHNSHIGPAFRRLEAGEVGHPLPVRRRSLELTGEHVGRPFLRRPQSMSA